MKIRPSTQTSREFQVFAKPVGPVCNLGCRYCYYLDKAGTEKVNEAGFMPYGILESYIAQHIEAFPGPVVNFSWHGGEPTLAGLEYFRKIVEIQQRHCPSHRRISNGIQTNGTLLNTDWCRFLAAENFTVGISLDGPRALHDRYRVTKKQAPTHESVMRGLDLLRRHRIPFEILCVVHAHSVHHPLEVYRFFRKIGAGFITFLPLVERLERNRYAVSRRTVPAKAFGDFLCKIFDTWVREDIGRIKVQIFEEATRTAFGQPHSLCIFRRTCGDIPVVERSGDVYSCDHFVDDQHHLGNVQGTHLAALLEGPAQRDFGESKWKTLPQTCRKCAVLEMCNGGCPKNRFAKTPDGEAGLNHLCEGYKQFFAHCRPFVNAVAEQWRQNNHHMTSETPAVKIGRNDPCPCGSGRKFKKCCLV
jgi:uncharacterized protein